MQHAGTYIKLLHIVTM